jgi:hypothetical protein
MYASEESGASMLWDYSAARTRIGDLYDLAKTRVWNASDDLDWNQVCRQARRTEQPILQEANPLRGFGPYEQLSGSEKIHLLWRRHGLEISEILQGEQGALLLSSQLIACMPTVEARLFASSQVNDEARHVEFFSRYLSEVVGEISPPGYQLERLIRRALDDPRWQLKMIICQILIESLALSRFQQLQRECAVPLLRCALAYILRDEARHVSFGMQLLRVHLCEAGPQQLDAYGGEVLEGVLALNEMDLDMRIAGEMGWDCAALRFHLRRHRLRHPENTRRRFRLLARNLEAVGLLCGRTRQRLQELCG